MSSPLAAVRLSSASDGNSSTVEPSVDTSSPAHHEVDVLPAARVGDNAAVGGGNLQFCWLLSGERAAASSGHERSFPCAAMATLSFPFAPGAHPQRQVLRRPAVPSPGVYGLDLP